VCYKKLAFCKKVIKIAQKVIMVLEYFKRSIQPKALEQFSPEGFLNKNKSRENDQA
jgi:hypothetical protein